MKKILIIIMTILAIILTPIMASGEELSWQIASEADWYQGTMTDVSCNDSNSLYFNGERILFEDSFLWDNISDSGWTLASFDYNYYLNDGIMHTILDASLDSQIKISTTSGQSRDRLELGLWNVNSPIDVNNHIYQVVWKVKTSVDNCKNLMEIWVNNQDSDRILYDYGGYEVPYYRDQISVKVGSIRHNEKFEHWGNMATSEWSTGSIIFGQGQFLAFNDKFGNGELYQEADNSQYFSSLGCLTAINPGIYIKTADKGAIETWWFDYFKVVQLDTPVSWGTYLSEVWNAGSIQDWSGWSVTADSTGDVTLEYGIGDGIFYSSLAEVPNSSTLQFKITMQGNSVVNNIIFTSGANLPVTYSKVVINGGLEYSIPDIYMDELIQWLENHGN